MDLRLALYEIAAVHGLAAGDEQRLERLAGLHDEPAGLATLLPRAVAVLGAALGGFGLVLWVAANWQLIGRAGRFALLEGLLLVLAAGVLWRPAARTPLGLLALLTIGGAFALFGQTYQTGADAWLLFAFWAALALPLCVALRSDVLWAPWALVAATGISLWVYAHTGHSWRLRAGGDLRAFLLGWAAALVLVGGLGAPFRERSGAGPWALRTAITLTTVMIASSSLIGLFDGHQPLAYVLGLATLAGGTAALAMPRSFDIFGLCAVALALDTLLVCGLARLLFESMHSGDSALFVIGLVAAGLVAATVAAVLRLSRARSAEPGAR